MQGPSRGLAQASRSLRQRASGVLLHPTCLPGPHGSGDLGLGARAFVDFLAAADQTWWQMLPVGPPGYGESPYSAESAFAGNPFLVSLEALAAAGLLEPRTVAPSGPLRDDRVDYPSMAAHRSGLLRAAFEAFQARGNHRGLGTFCQDNASWLEDFALFRALKRAHGGVQWTQWSAALRTREPRRPGGGAQATSRARWPTRSSSSTSSTVQWAELRAYAAERGSRPHRRRAHLRGARQRRRLAEPRAFFLDERGRAHRGRRRAPRLLQRDRTALG